MRYKFWKSLTSFSNKKQREAFLHERNADLRCPRCLTWTSEYDNFKIVDDPNDPEIIGMTCGKCNETSRWFMGAPVAIRLEKVKKEREETKDGEKTKTIKSN